MVLISVQSVETDNGYQFKNDFAESIRIDPNSRVSLVNMSYERKIEYLVLANGNEFELKVGSPNSNLDRIVIPQGTYDATGLAQEIEEVLNRRYVASGHGFNVKYDTKAQRFSIDHIVRQTKLSNVQINDWDIGGGTGAPLITLGKNPISLNLAGITRGTAEFADTTEFGIATSDVPDNNHGGSIFQSQISFTGLPMNAPILTQQTSSFGIAMWSNSLVNNQPATAIKELNDVNMTWCDMGIVFSRGIGPSYTIKIYENGVNIFQAPTASRGFLPKTLDTYKIELTSDDTHPQYYYKRHGGRWKKFTTQQSIQTITKDDWENTALKGMVFANQNGENADFKFLKPTQSSQGVPLLKPVVIDPLVNKSTITDAGKGNGLELLRTEYGGGLEDGDEMGFVSQVVNADFTSEFSFKLKANTNKLVSVGVVDENNRVVNFLASGGGLGTDDNIYGATCSDNGANAETAPNFNPAVGAFLFDTTNNIIQHRLSKNGKCDFDIEEKILPALEDITRDVDFTTAQWVAGTDPRFYVKCIASTNTLMLTCSPSDDALRKDEVIVCYDFSNLQDFSQIGTFAVNAVGNNGEYPANSNLKFEVVQSLTFVGSNGVVVLHTDANGQFDNAVSVEMGGTGYENGVARLRLIDETTGARAVAGTGTITITANNLATDVFNELNTSASDDKAIQGYRWSGAVRDWDGDATASQTGISGLELSVEDDEGVVGNSYCEFHPQAEPNFGNMIGFNHNNYILTNVPTIGDNPQPDLNAKLNPSILINVNNLPHKSYVGMKLKEDAVLGEAPIGNTQGLTKLVGKVPRYHSDDHPSNSGLAGAFYYDYFPYSIPLKNATELLLNELDISITNPDGTLAKDIINTHLLLDLTQVASVGEGDNPTIGRAMELRQTQVQRDINKSQLEPSIRGSFGGVNGESGISSNPDKFNRGGEASNSPFTTPL